MIKRRAFYLQGIDSHIVQNYFHLYFMVKVRFEHFRNFFVCCCMELILVVVRFENVMKKQFFLFEKLNFILINSD